MDAFIRAYDIACDSINTFGLSHYGDLIATHCHVSADIVDSLTDQHPVRFRHVSPPRQRDIDRAKKWLEKK